MVYEFKSHAMQSCKVIFNSNSQFIHYKVLDRKNTEIEGIKSHFRNKLNEGEETRRRQEKKSTSFAV